MEEEEKEEEKKKEGDVSLWQQSLDSPIYLLQRAASKYNIAIVLIN
jgi:hypothetical protein